MKIKMLVMDVDGTMTDGNIYISGTGETFKAFNIKDGYTIYNLGKEDIVPVIITGRESQIVAKRAEELKIKEIYQGVSDKLSKLKEVCDKIGCCINEVAYIGDDYNDLDCIKVCGYTGCPADAEDDIKPFVDYICSAKSGEGVIREFVKHIIQYVNSK